MLHRVEKTLAALVVGLNFFMMGMEETSLYTILPKYLTNQSMINDSNHTVSNISTACYVQKPPYVIVSMIFLSKSLAMLFFNSIMGAIIDKMNNYFILILAHVFGVVISLIYAFNNTILLYVIGRIFDAFVSSAIFIAIFSIISKLFPNVITRGRYFGLANILYFTSHSIGPVYGAEIDDNLGKASVFLLLVPMWIVCSLLTFLLYWRVYKDEKRDEQCLEKNATIVTDLILLELKKSPGSVDSEIEDGFSDEGRKPLNVLKYRKERKKSEELTEWNRKKNMFIPVCKMMKDPFVMGCLLQILIVNINIYALPPTLPSWMAFRLCSTEVQQGLVWTFGFLGYLSGVSAIVLIDFYAPKLRLFAPVFAQVTIGILLIAMPFSRDWRLLFIPIIGVYFSVGIVEQVIFPITTTLADSRFQSNYGTMSSLTSQSLTLSGVISTVCSGPVAGRFGFRSLAFSLGLINLLTSPISLIHRNSVTK